MRKFLLWPALVAAALLLALAIVTVVSRYDLDFWSPAMSVRLKPPAAH